MTPPRWRATHRALLRVLLGTGGADEALAWLRVADLDRLDPETARLLPRLHARLRALAVPEAELPGRLKGLVRHTWAANQSLWRAAAPALEALDRARINWQLIGGGAVLAACGGDLAARRLRDMDVLVRGADFAAAADLLRAAGWRTHVQDAPALLAWFHRIRWTHPSGLLDLHARVILEDLSDENLAEAWRGSRAAMLADRAVRIPPAAQLLLQVATAGWFTPRPPALGCVVDTADLLRVGGIEAADFAAAARRAGLASQAAWSLAVLHDVVPSSVPEATRAALPTPARDPALRWHAALGSLPRLRRAHRRAGAPGAFPAAFREATGLSLADAARRRVSPGHGGAP